MDIEKPQPQHFFRYQIPSDQAKYLDWILAEVYALRSIQKDFTTQFIESVYHQWRNRHWLSIRQLDALESIYERAHKQGGV